MENTIADLILFLKNNSYIRYISIYQFLHFDVKVANKNSPLHLDFQPKNQIDIYNVRKYEYNVLTISRAFLLS